jgi:branched-chain amino acid transport system ATP-binding protein
MLEVKDLAVAYGRVQAVKGISFSVEQGTIVSLLGTNGAGKTTTLRTISGLLRPTAGEILFEGKRIDTVPAHQIVTLGIAQSPEGRRLFPRMSVEDNLLLGAYTRKDTAGIREDLDRAYALFPVLGERRGQAAGLFSGGEQQMLAIARAMMSRPRLLMLDEPSMGLSPDHDDHDHEHDRGAEGDRHDHLAGGAERPGGPRAVRSGVCAGGRVDHLVRHRARPCWRTTASGAPIWASTDDRRLTQRPGLPTFPTLCMRGGGREAS